MMPSEHGAAILKQAQNQDWWHRTVTRATQEAEARGRKGQSHSGLEWTKASQGHSDCLNKRYKELGRLAQW